MCAVFSYPIAISGLANYFPSNSKTFKQLQVEMTLEIPPEKPDIEHILRDIVDVRITETFVLETPYARSYEGQVLTGRKLLINGEILQKLEYAADNCTQSVHAVEFSTRFFTYIILDGNAHESFTYNVNAYVEDVFIKQLDERSIFKSVMLLLDAVQTNAELLGSLNNEPSPDCEGDKFIGHGNMYHEKLFTQLCCQETIKLPTKKPDVEQIVSVISDPEIISVKFINTMKGTSIEGQQLTGKKAVVEICFRQKTLYVADCKDQAIYGVESIFYKNAYIVLPSLIEGTDPALLYKNKLLKLKLTIEDLYFTNLGKRRIYNSICLRAEVQLVPTYEICYSAYQNCERSDLFLCFNDGSRSTQIAKNKQSKNIKPCWSPSGSQIAYLSGSRQGYSLFSFNIKSNSQEMLVKCDSFENISSFSWLKDSQQIIFSALRNQSKELYLLNIAGSCYRQITEGAGLIKSYYPKVSPDGCYVAFLRSSACKVDLWYSDIYGKNPRRLTDTGSIRDFDWLADSSGLVYIDNNDECSCEIYLAMLNKQQTSSIFKSDSMYGCKTLAVSPDGCFAAFVGTNKCSDDIYVYDMQRDKTSNITNHHNSMKISSIAWKIDSSKIYYAAKEFLHYDICSVDIASLNKVHLANTEAAYMQLAYRPRIK